MEEATIGNQVVCLDQWISQVEQRVVNLETKAAPTTMRINSEQAYVDNNLNKIEPTLIALTHRMKIIEEIMENWDRNCETNSNILE